MGLRKSVLPQKVLAHALPAATALQYPGGVSGHDVRFQVDARSRAQRGQGGVVPRVGNDGDGKPVVARVRDGQGNAVDGDRAFLRHEMPNRRRQRDGRCGQRENRRYPEPLRRGCAGDVAARVGRVGGQADALSSL